MDGTLDFTGFPKIVQKLQDLPDLESKLKFIKEETKTLLALEQRVLSEYAELKKTEAEIQEQKQYIENWNKEHGS